MSAKGEEKKGNRQKINRMNTREKINNSLWCFFGKLAKKGLKSSPADNSGIFPKQKCCSQKMHLVNLVRQLVWEYVLKGSAQTNKLTVIKVPESAPTLCIGNWFMSPGPGLPVGEGTGILMSRLCAQHPNGDCNWVICHPHPDTSGMRGCVTNDHTGPEVQIWTVPTKAGCAASLTGTLTSPRNPPTCHHRRGSLIQIVAFITGAFTHKQS